MRLPVFGPWQSAIAPLPVILIDAYFDPIQPIANLRVELGADLTCDPPCDLLGGGIDDRQKHAVFLGQDPALLLESQHNLGLLDFDLDHGMVHRDEHMMIQLLDELGERISKGDEIDHVAILVEMAADLGSESVIMSVQALADIACKGDEMR